jgi:hypothetical protein
MDCRKEISNAYKERKLYGGVYTITNTINGKYLLSHSPNLKSAQNRFEFALSAGAAAAHPKLQKDWEAFGASAFKFEVLEELEQNVDQTEAEFGDDLKILEQLWSAKLDPSQKY